MVLPLGPMGGAPLGLASGPPPRVVMKLRPFLQIAVFGCTVAVLLKFYGHQQRTALSDLFPIGAGFVILFSQSNFYTCIMVFMALSGLAFIFSSYYLGEELVTPTRGGRHFFATSCKRSFEIEMSHMQSGIKLCDYDNKIYGGCDPPMTCSVQEPQKLYIWEDWCSTFSIIGHVGLILSVVFNGMSTYVGSKMYHASRMASQALMADGNFGQGMGTELDGLSGRQGSAHQANQFHAFQGVGQTLGTNGSA